MTKMLHRNNLREDVLALVLTVSWVMGGVGWGEGVELRTSHPGDRKEPALATATASQEPL